MTVPKSEANVCFASFVWPSGFIKDNSHWSAFSAMDNCVYARRCVIFYLCVDAVGCGKRRLMVFSLIGL